MRLSESNRPLRAARYQAGIQGQRAWGKAVMHEGLQRLREIGAHTAFVTAVHDNEAARGLYESVGFHTVNRERLYGKKL